MILGIFAAIGRWFRSIFAKGEGQIEAATDRNLRDPYAIDALYRRALEDDSAAIDQLAEVVGMIEGNIASEEARLKTLVEDSKDGLIVLKQDLEGAYAVGEDIYAKLSAAGKTDADIQADKDFKEAMAFAQDAESTIAERESLVAEVKSGLQEWRDMLEDTDSKLKELHRQLGQTKRKRASAKSQALVASRMDKVASLRAGIQLKGTNELLQRADEAVAQMVGAARAKQRLAGMDDSSQRERFRAKAAERAAGNKFMERVRGAVKGEVSPEPEVKATDAAATESTDGSKGPSGPAPLT